MAFFASAETLLCLRLWLVKIRETFSVISWQWYYLFTLFNSHQPTHCEKDKTHAFQAQVGTCIFFPKWKKDLNSIIVSPYDITQCYMQIIFDFMQPYHPFTSTVNSYRPYHVRIIHVTFFPSFFLIWFWMFIPCCFHLLVCLSMRHDVTCRVEEQGSGPYF